MNLASFVRRGLYRAESWLDRNVYRIRLRFGWLGPLSIRPYRTFGTSETLVIQGRVLSFAQTRRPHADDPWRRNLWSAVRALASDELPKARVRAGSGPEAVEGETDEEGYFRLEIPGKGRRGWIETELELIAPGPARAVAETLVPAAEAELGVISDLDDTVIMTNVPHPLETLRWMLLYNALSRRGFEGTAELYRALAAGAGGRAHNPIFYVSSGSWNFYDLVEQFLDHNGFPRGPILLRDIGLDKEHFLAEGNEHKLAKIERILASFPELLFILIGDTGQDDPFLYAEAVRRHPGRIRAIYLRDVSDSKRAAVMELAARVNDQGLIMRIFGSAAEAMEWVKAAGWIS